MKTFIFLIVSIGFFSFSVYSQNNDWTWMHGSATTTNLSPTYGVLGSPSSVNSPGARRSSITVTDLTGNLWLFGGLNTTGNYMGDLWKYTVSTNEWTWMNGPNTANNFGIYGTQGVASSSNSPGGRTYSHGWADNNGNIWIFGGYGYSSNAGPTLLNDLWKYNIASNQWTWIKGSFSGAGLYGTYGTQGVSAPINTPGGRYLATTGKDNSNNLILFGGYGYGSSTYGMLNDIWKFNTSTNNWTWVKGMGVSNQFSSFGVQGVASSSNTPGGRYASTGCSDANGNLWVFGGNGMINGGSGYINELWKFDSNTNNWTFYSGSALANQSGIYGVQGVASGNNFPGCRMFYGRSSIIDQTGNFWTFGGYGYSSGGAGYMNDVWRFNTSTNQWVWMKGSTGPNQYGQYGTQGVGSSVNTPGARYMQTNWLDNLGKFWVYGGAGYSGTTSGDLSDLWKLDICSIPLNPVSSTPNTNLTRCSTQSTTLSATSGTTTINWFNSPTSTAAIATGTSYTSPALLTIANSTVINYYAEAMTCGPSAARVLISVTVNPTPTLSVNSGSICQGGVFPIIPNGASTYTFSGGQQIVSPMINTVYTVSGTSFLGCPSLTNALSNVAVFPSPNIVVNSGTICPGNAFTINPSGANTYTISGGSSVVSPTVSSFYFVSGTNLVGCVSQSPVISSVIVSPFPIVAAPNGTICQGQSFLISPNGANTYTITGGSFNVSPSINTTYSVIGSNSNGCVSINPALVLVSVINSPTITVNSGTICSGNSFTITPTGAANYTFLNTSSVISPTITSTYTVLGSSLNGCVGTPAIANVSVNAVPSLTFSASSNNICLEQSTVALNGLPSGGVYSGTNVSGNIFTAPTTGAFSPVYSFTDTATGCNASASVFILVENCVVGIEQTSINSQVLSVFPNPNNGTFKIITPNNSLKNIAVYDLVGQVVFVQETNEEIVPVNISDVAPGVYFVSMQIGDDIITKKIIKN